MTEQSPKVTALTFETTAAALSVRRIDFSAGALCSRDPREAATGQATDCRIARLRVAQRSSKRVYVTPDSNGFARGSVSVWAGGAEIGRLRWDQDAPDGTTCFDWSPISSNFHAKVRYAVGPRAVSNTVTLKVERVAGMRDLDKPQITVGALGFAGL